MLRRNLYKLKRKRQLSEYLGDDNTVFLVSYPKSGNSWLRFLIANSLNHDGNMKLGFHNLHKIVPDSHSLKQREEVLMSEEFKNRLVRIIKTHDPCFSFYKRNRVIYLYRNSSNVIKSYHKYLNSRLANKIGYQDIVYGRTGNSFGTWFEHNKSWFLSKNKRILYVCYEDLRRDPFTQLRRIVDFIGLNTSDVDLKRSIELSDLSNMKKIENEFGYFNDNRTLEGKNVSFVGEGKIDSNPDAMPNEIKRYLANQQDVIDRLSKQKVATLYDRES